MALSGQLEEDMLEAVSGKQQDMAARIMGRFFQTKDMRYVYILATKCVLSWSSQVLE